MKTCDFYYDLPQELIAQTPMEKRDGSRLMILDRRTGEIGHRRFYDLPSLLCPGECLGVPGPPGTEAAGRGPDDLWRWFPYR